MNIVAPAIVKRYAKGTDSDAADAMVVNALDRKGGGADDNDAQAGHLVAHTLRAEGFDASEDGTGRGTPLVTAFDRYNGTESELAPTLPSPKTGGFDHVMVSDERGPAHVDPLVSRSSRGKATPLSPGHNTDSHVAVTRGQVRRLTPSECEALQGFPRGWTLLEPDTDWRTYPQPDGRRYAACGDAVTVNVSHWIGRRLLRVDASLDTTQLQEEAA